MNKKAVVEGGTLVAVMAIVLFIVGLAGGFKVFNLLESMPSTVWWIITAIVLYLIFKVKK